MPRNMSPTRLPGSQTGASGSGKQGTGMVHSSMSLPDRGRPGPYLIGQSACRMGCACRRPRQYAPAGAGLACWRSSGGELIVGLAAQPARNATTIRHAAILTMVTSCIAYWPDRRFGITKGFPRAVDILPGATGNSAVSLVLSLRTPCRETSFAYNLLRRDGRPRDDNGGCRRANDASGQRPYCAAACRTQSRPGRAGCPASGKRPGGHHGWHRELPDPGDAGRRERGHGPQWRRQCQRDRFRAQRDCCFASIDAIGRLSAILLRPALQVVSGPPSRTITRRASSTEDGVSFDGGANRNRTDDLLNAIQALSQLSYGPADGRRLIDPVVQADQGPPVGLFGRLP
jgi:hypothetical protein